ncbi:MAG TPA: kanamycin nucleotidyltransferase C-terminal domain-containing protein [Chloroflexota bacterium]|nr:kanamycin nucleotidyltransferase C-terminal domain-containing protein [Chloroflexota bacterium]
MPALTRDDAFQTDRVTVAQRIVEECRQELGSRLLAAACYGSVAHHAAGPHSDVEIVLVTDDTVPYRDEYFFQDGILVECTTLSAMRMLEAASRIPPDWGIKYDQYRHHLALYDSVAFFPRLHAVADARPNVPFSTALQESWFTAYEMRGKVLNAVAAGDTSTALSAGWSFAFWAAMRIALHERVPYESTRTLWKEVAARGYGMRDLIEALTAGKVADVPRTVEAVWHAMDRWDMPPSYSP